MTLLRRKRFAEVDREFLGVAMYRPGAQVVKGQ
jgi:hypothetical protein